MTLSTGQILNNRYRIVKLLGQGGFGAVYRAWDISLEQPRALKENLETSPEAQRQFRREALILAGLNHPNLPRVIDHFVIPDQGHYLVMEYVDGEDLQCMLDRVGGPLPEAQVLPWMVQVCDALAYLHAQNPPVIHRDIKPANIRITSRGQAMLVDFGIAKVGGASSGTTVGARAVTPGFSPPEQYGLGITDAQSDIYALGATLYCLLTGKVPPASVDMLAGLAPGSTSPRTINAQVSPYLDLAVTHAMRPNRSERFKQIDDFQQALRGASAQPVRASFPVQVEPTRVISGPLVERAAPAPLSHPAGAAAFPVQPAGREPHSGPPMVSTQVVPPAYPSIPVSSAPRQPLPWKWLVLGVGGLLFVAAVAAVMGMLVASWGNQPPAAALAPETSAAGKDEMVLIPAGSFEMGAADGDASERPVAVVTMGAFYIDLYEVSNAHYAACVADGACKPPRQTYSATRSQYYGNPEFADYPVVYVNWNMALDYCTWRGARLPNEVEWERAARGGVDKRPYPWGYSDPDCTKANLANCWKDTAAVNSYPPNEFGLYNMAGNVWEWLSSAYKPYPYQPDDGREDVNKVLNRTLRGGAWDSPALDLRVSERRGDAPGYASDHNGFRCARSP